MKKQGHKRYVMPNSIIPKLNSDAGSKPRPTYTKTNNRPTISKNVKQIVITEELFLRNEDYSNSLSRTERDLFFELLQKESVKRFSFAKKSRKPIVNMVFFGHWGWVFSNILLEYKKHATDFEIIPSVYPIEGADAYVYWRSVNQMAKKFFNRHLIDKNRSEYLKKGIMMLHDSPVDIKRFDPKYKSTWFHKFRWVQCTSVEQCNYVRSFSPNYFYSPLGVNKDFKRKDFVNFTGKINIGFVGRAYGDGVKNEHSLLKIATGLNSNNFCFTILSSNLQEISDSIKSKGFRVFTNKEGNFMDLYKDIDVLIILSNYEGTPLPLIESMSLGHTVLSTNVGEASTYLEKDYILNTSESFVRKLNEINNNRSILLNNYEKNPLRVENNTWENFVKKSVQIWEKM